MFPGRNDLLQDIPSGDELTLAKLSSSGLINTDGANTTHRYCQNLVKEVWKEAIAQRVSEADIKTFEGDCWHHMRNVWFGAVKKLLSVDLSETWKEDLRKIHPMLQVSANPVEKYHAIKRCFAKTAN